MSTLPTPAPAVLAPGATRSPEARIVADVAALIVPGDRRSALALLGAR